MIYDMIRYDTKRYDDMIYDMIYIYLLTAIGLTPGGSSTIHIYTQTTHRMTQLTTRTTQLTTVTVVCVCMNQEIEIRHLEASDLPTFIFH